MLGLPGFGLGWSQLAIVECLKLGPLEVFEVGLHELMLRLWLWWQSCLEPWWQLRREIGCHSVSGPGLELGYEGYRSDRWTVEVVSRPLL